MSLQKILGLVGVLIVVVGAFVAIPYAPLILLVIGLVLGYGIAREDHVRVIVSALALKTFAGAFTAVPGDVGSYLVAIVSGLGDLAVGAALTIILVNMYNRLKP